MIGFGTSRRAILEAINRSQAIIEFSMDGTILTANRKFLDAFGYTLAELKGRHHSLFLAPGEAGAPAYKAFWDNLRRGQYQLAEYRRLAKGGREVWIQASYNPVAGWTGEPRRIIKLATVITDAKRRGLEDDGKLKAIDRSQAVVELALDGTILHANAHFCHALGYALDEMLGRHHSIFMDPAERGSARYTEFWESLRRGKYQQGEYRRIAKGGRDVWLQACYNPVLGLDGEPVKIVKIATDITAEVKRRTQVQLLSLVADETSNAVVITDARGLIQYVNAGFVRMTGYSFEEVCGRRPGDVLQGPDTSMETRHELRQKLRQEQPFYHEILNYTKAGEPYWISLFINPVKDGHGHVTRFISIQTNVTERKKTEDRLTFIARHDALTGLANRTLFRERLLAALESTRPVGLLLLDLDHFKKINDTFGHPAGDEVLRQVAVRLGECVRVSDTVARLGGDEFAVICDGFDAISTVRVVADCIFARIAEPFSLGSYPVQIGVSIGIATAFGSNISLECLIEQADQALYRAKGAGRGTFRVFEPETIAV